jgi:hypothetical protein
MTILSEENMVRVLDMLCTNPSPTRAARAIGGADKLIWQWGTKSAAKAAMNVPIEESGFGVHWPDPDGPLVWFHEAFQQASRIFFSLASMEHSALIGPDAGHKRVARDGSGRIQFKVDLKVASDAMRMDDVTWELCYGDRPKTDIFERDENGCLIPDTFTEPLPAQLRIHLLRSLLPSQFNPESRTTSEVIHAGGVLVVGEHKPDKPPNALRDDMEARLARVLAGRSGHDNPNSTKKPTAPVTIMGRGESGPPEKVSQPSNETPATLADHPRAYQQALPAPKPQEPTDFRRPTRALNNEDRRSPMPSGGFSLTRGRPT